jgi:hypothetical protein
MKMMEEYILIRRQTVALYVATRLTLTKCRRGKRKRGAIPHRWWWEQPMDWTSTTQLGQTSDGPGSLPSLFCMGEVRLVGMR